MVQEPGTARVARPGVHTAQHPCVNCRMNRGLDRCFGLSGSGLIARSINLPRGFVCLPQRKRDITDLDHSNPADLPQRSSRYLSLGLTVLGMLAAAALLLVAALNGPYMHDEESYITGAYFARDHAPYGDFIFLQPPYFALVFGTVFRFVDSNFFLTARLVVFALSLTSIALLFVLARRLSGSRLIAASAVALLICSTVVNPAFGWARNDILAIFFSLAAMLAFVAGDRSGGRVAIWLKVLAGAAAGCAVGTKVSYVFLPAGLFLVEAARFALKPGPDRSLGKLAGLCAGGSLAAVPILWPAIVYQDGFFYGVYEHHIIAPPDWTAQIGREYRMNARTVVMDWLSFIRRDVTMGAAVFVGYAVLHTLMHHRERIKQEYSIHGDKALFLVLLALSVPLTLATKPVHIHYVQPVIPLLILFAVAHATAAADDAAFRRSFFAVMTVIVSIPGFAVMLGNTLNGSEIQRMARVSEEIRTALGADRRPVASASPIRVIDAGAEPYIEFATGPFFYRTAHLLPAARVQALGGASPQTLEALFAEKPPAAILAGYESGRGDIDGGLVRYAEANGFERIDIDGGVASLYVRRNRDARSARGIHDQLGKLSPEQGSVR